MSLRSPLWPDARPASTSLVVNTNSSGLIQLSQTACVAWLWFEAISGLVLAMCVETVLAIRGQRPLPRRGQVTRRHPMYLSVCILWTEQNPARIHRHTIYGRSGGAGLDHRSRGAVHRNYPDSTAVNAGRERVPRREHPVAIAQYLVRLKLYGICTSILRCTLFFTRVPGLIFESVLFILVVVRFIQTWMKGGICGTPLLVVFVRDGAWAFVLIFGE